MLPGLPLILHRHAYKNTLKLKLGVDLVDIEGQYTIIVSSSIASPCISPQERPFLSLGLSLASGERVAEMERERDLIKAKRKMVGRY